MCSRHVGTKRTMEKLNSCHLPPYIFLCLNFWLFSFLQPKLFLINTCVILSVFSTNSIMPQLKFQNYVILKVMRFRAGNFQSPIDCVQPCVSLSDTIGSQFPFPRCARAIDSSAPLLNAGASPGKLHGASETLSSRGSLFWFSHPPCSVHVFPYIPFTLYSYLYHNTDSLFCNCMFTYVFPPLNYELLKSGITSYVSDTQQVLRK